MLNRVVLCNCKCHGAGTLLLERPSAYPIAHSLLSTLGGFEQLPSRFVLYTFTISGSGKGKSLRCHAGVSLIHRHQRLRRFSPPPSDQPICPYCKMRSCLHGHLLDHLPSSSGPCITTFPTSSNALLDPTLRVLLRHSVQIGLQVKIRVLRVLVNCGLLISLVLRL